MVYVTHDQQEAMALADRIALMREGRIEQIGTPRELYLQPASTYVAQFIGRPQMNLLPAKDGVITGIRPDDLRLDPAGSPCTILSREWFGATRCCWCAAIAATCGWSAPERKRSGLSHASVGLALVSIASMPSAAVVCRQIGCHPIEKLAVR